MAKKHFGRFVALAAIAGTAAAGVSYFLRYKSFHKELDEDFHDFEDDFDEDLKEFGDTKDTAKTVTRNYVPLNTDRSSVKDCECSQKENAAEETKDAPDENAQEGPAVESETAHADAENADTDGKAEGEFSQTETADSDFDSDSEPASTPAPAGPDADNSEFQESPKKLEQPATIIIEDTTE